MKREKLLCGTCRKFSQSARAPQRGGLTSCRATRVCRALALFFIFSFSFFTFEATAQGDVTFDVAAPTAVEAGELFRIEFVVNGALGAEFTPPAIEGFEVMAGPSESTGTSVSIINGTTTRTETTTYTYVLQGFTTGVHTIAAAQARVRGKVYSTRPLSIEVVAGAGGAQQGAQQGGVQGGAQTDTSRTIAADDIFVRLSVSSSQVYKGEPIVATLRLYSRIPLGGLDAFTPPAFNGFWQQDISASDVGEQRETLNNRVYSAYTLKEYLLYPQQSGTLVVEPFEATVTALLQAPSSPSSRSIFDELMGLADGGYQPVPKKLSSPRVNVSVRDWPAGAPEGFDGAVGRFDLSVTPPPSVVGANNSASYALRLEGTGNFPLIRTPGLELPQSFEQYNVTTSDNTRHTRNGTSGYREFTYPFIPRTDGTYTIPAVEFTYFDPKTGRYVTLASREISLEVTADSTAIGRSGGVVSGISREDLQIFGQDIRFIERGGAGLKPKGRVFMWSGLFVALVGGFLVLAGVGFVVLRRKLALMQSDKFVRNKRANKMALKRLRAAEAAMNRNDKHGFYNEMLRGLLGYMGDKLDIPAAELSKDRIREELFERGVSEVDADGYTSLISACEQAQYSPGGPGQMDELYRKGVELISQLEL